MSDTYHHINVDDLINMQQCSSCLKQLINSGKDLNKLLYRLQACIERLDNIIDQELEFGP